MMITYEAKPEWKGSTVNSPRRVTELNSFSVLNKHGVSTKTKSRKWNPVNIDLQTCTQNSSLSNYMHILLNEEIFQD